LINPEQPKVFGVKFSLREIERIFSIEVRNSKLWKMPKQLNFRFPGFFLIIFLFFYFYNTELKRSLTNFSVSERHRWAVVG